MCEKHYKKIEHIQHWVSNVDTKASIILGVTGLFFSIIFANKELLQTLLKSFIETKNLLNHNIQVFSGFLISISCCLAIFFGVRTFYFLLKVLVGRINPEIYNQEGLDTNSIYFFGTIAKNNYSEYKENVTNKSDELKENDLLSQVYINSKICSTKFEYYNKAMKNFSNLFITLLVILVLIILKSFI